MCIRDRNTVAAFDSVAQLLIDTFAGMAAFETADAQMVAFAAFFAARRGSSQLAVGAAGAGGAGGDLSLIHISKMKK